MYPDNEVLWLRDAAAFLNVALTTTEPPEIVEVFCDKPLHYLTKEMRKTLGHLLEHTSEGAKQTGFETFLANMAHDMLKGSPWICAFIKVSMDSWTFFILGLSVIGYMILLQMLGEAYPALCSGNMTRFIELRNSYQNRPKIGLALLWGVGQGGKKDLETGLKGLLIWFYNSVDVIWF